MSSVEKRVFSSSFVGSFTRFFEPFGCHIVSLLSNHLISSRACSVSSAVHSSHICKFEYCAGLLCSRFLLWPPLLSAVDLMLELNFDLRVASS
ncbi:hypothetical protein OUZ56_031340 [Daphnia magna]|uniref:Uncharacterized protein n=1 Tax=Daphnia magna TaxID=35525 RepID=A0ABQ9ZV44_9CRUS|nr:hypothetical protein OUZ56_031340 [Daphnia magna]